MRAYAATSVFALAFLALALGSPPWSGVALVVLGALATRLIADHRQRVRCVREGSGAPLPRSEFDARGDHAQNERTGCKLTAG